MTKPQDTGRSTEQDKTSPLTADLKARISRARASHEAAERAKAGSEPRNMSGWSRGLRLSSEFLAAILVGVVLGYLLDQALGTTPWLLLVMLIIGFAAGVLNVVRSTAAMNQAVAPQPDAQRARNDEQDV